MNQFQSQLPSSIMHYNTESFRPPVRFEPNKDAFIPIYTGGTNDSIKIDSLYSDGGVSHGADTTVFHHGSHIDESDMMMDESEYSAYHVPYPEEDELAEGMILPRAVHQCNVCNKIFVSFKGLQQHAVIHTDQKPYQCDICAKSFRFKSNLFEHRSVHTGFTPHACPYCGKTCRLKGNLKKHLRTHVTTKEELEAAWRPFASNRRPPADIPDDAIIVRGPGTPFLPQSSKFKRKKLGLGPDARVWIDRLKRGEILPEIDMVEKVRRLEDTVFNSMINTTPALLECARSVSFETHDCPVCKASFLTKHDCAHHYNVEHPAARAEIEYFCDKCFRQFHDMDSYDQHESYHTRVCNMLDTGVITRGDPQILVPTQEDLNLMFGDNVSMSNPPSHGMLDTLSTHVLTV